MGSRKCLFFLFCITNARGNYRDLGYIFVRFCTNSKKIYLNLVKKFEFLLMANKKKKNCEYFSFSKRKNLKCWQRAAKVVTDPKHVRTTGRGLKFNILDN